jgi:FixJ family two-component response regulator
MNTTTANSDPAALISIVDDEPCVRRSLSRFIRSAGYATKEYDSAEAFLTWGWRDEAACLILDVRLPAMGGLELQRYLADQQPARPIVFISGQATENEQTWAMMKGAVAFLPKPFSDESLLHAVRLAVARESGRFDADRPPNKVCPLCRESAQVAAVPSHLIVDHIDLRMPAVRMIQTLNPTWSENEGLCYRCWEFYVGLGRAVNFISGPALSLDGKPQTNLKV